MPSEPALRVALISPYDLSRPGGVQGQVRGLAAALVAAGHAAAVIAPDDRRPGWVPGGPADRYATGRSVALPANGSVAPVSLSPAAASRALRAVRAWGADVVHLHEPLAPVLGYGFLLSSRWPLVATFHRAGGGGGYRAAAPLGRWATRRLDVRCAVSEVARQTAESACGGTYEVLFNGVDVGRFRPGRQERQGGPGRSGPPAALFLGRHEPRKGLGVLLDAFEAVPPPAELWVAGSGPETARLQAEHPGGERLKWLGALTDAEVTEQLLAADVLCAPSLGGESFGLVLLEGMAAGCAVVASDIPGYRDAAGGHATLVPPGDAGALGEALRRALGRAPAGGALGGTVVGAREAAAAHAERWSLDRLASCYVTLYRQAAASRQARSSRAAAGTIQRR